MRWGYRAIPAGDELKFKGGFWRVDDEGWEGGEEGGLGVRDCQGKGEKGEGEERGKGEEGGNLYSNIPTSQCS